MPSKKTDVLDIKDISELCLNWDQFRPMVSDAKLTDTTLDEDTKHLIRWMRDLTDISCRRYTYDRKIDTSSKS